MSNVDRMVAKAGGAGDFARRYVEYLGSLLTALDFEALERFAGLLEDARAADRTVFFVGNGGSAAMASHWCNDLMLGTRPPSGRQIRAISLTDNVPVLTAIGNDRDYADVFVAQLESLLRTGDLLVAISASGNSPNVVRAVEYTNAHGGTTVGLLGFDGGKLRALCTLAILVATPKGEYGPVEDAHMVIDHVMMSWLKERFRAGSGM